ncbi:hypothetical protein [Flavobacterium sp. FlaQc-47]|uniref:hypothetical protein n=1 Tax=Flavobacterium sp. FlaQc-47 TaxID=3374180 RepID=UPI003756C635
MRRSKPFSKFFREEEEEEAKRNLIRVGLQTEYLYIAPSDTYPFIIRIFERYDSF